jgi:hypothetical protein
MKIRPEGAEFFRADGRKDRQMGQTDKYEGKSHVSQFCERPKKEEKRDNIMQVIFFNCVGYRCKNVSAVMELGVSLTCF